MSDIHTFYIAPEFFGEEMKLTGQELRHLSQVLRLKQGAEVKIVDGAGRSTLATISSLSKKEAILKAKDIQFSPAPHSKAIIALALSKAVRRGFFLEKAVELGAWEVWLWQADHSQGKLPVEEKDSWQAKMIAGVKQSGNLWLPKVRAFHEGIEGVISTAKDAEHHILPWEVQEGIPMLSLKTTGLEGTTVYVIGPEGGFSNREIQLLRNADYTPVSFGKRILRCETAATLCLGLHWWASQQEGRADAPQI